MFSFLVKRFQNKDSYTSVSSNIPNCTSFPQKQNIKNKSLTFAQAIDEFTHKANADKIAQIILKWGKTILNYEG